MAVFGRPSSWNASLVSSLGLAAAGLSPPHLDSLSFPAAVSPAAVAHLGPAAIERLSPETRKRLAPEALARMNVRAEDERQRREYMEAVEKLAEHYRVKEDYFGESLLPGARRRGGDQPRRGKELDGEEDDGVAEAEAEVAGLGMEEIVGIAVGAAVLLIILVALLCCCWKKCQTWRPSGFR